ncbi:DUF1007 family protein [Escherichia coli]|uniref:DUF1007 family protein n=1 Tax=Escherichia coli TaxID=562 RepID=UPI000CFC6A76|nr:DUF1007 family protein [Escherichia coli]
MRCVNCPVITFWCVVLSFDACAHPHSFISLQTQAVTENGLLTGFKMRWTMDEITSADLLYDTGNARPDSEIWKKVAAEVMTNVQGQHYFSELWHNGQRIKFENRPDSYGLERSGHQVVLTFILPLAESQPLSGQIFTFSTYDPTYFVDMYYNKASDFTLPATIKTICTAKVITPKPDEKMVSYALSLDKGDVSSEDMKLGSNFAQKVRLQCQ